MKIPINQITMPTTSPWGVELLFTKNDNPIQFNQEKYDDRSVQNVGDKLLAKYFISCTWRITHKK